MDRLAVQVFKRNKRPSADEISFLVKKSNLLVPAGTRKIIKEIYDCVENYPKCVVSLMRRGFLRTEQFCNKCYKPMFLSKNQEVYEWTCNVDRDTICSVCPLKKGSWFENTNLPFNKMFMFVPFYTKNVPFEEIRRILDISEADVFKMRKVMFRLTDSIHSKHGKIGGKDKEVYVAVHSVSAMSNMYLRTYDVVAGREIGSKKCFIRVIPNANDATVRKAVKDHLEAGTLTTLVNTGHEEQRKYMDMPPMIVIDEMDLDCGPFKPDCFFEKLWESVPELHEINPAVLQQYFNEQVVRREQEYNYLARCVEEIQSYAN